uniref:ATP synthase complex subunit 8 n=1 Tax=Scincus scincus TaxID=155317 RepID=A0A7R7J4W0_9SAUR|nr:ATP synthase F0 subunit 8 [Scincus scincus]
MPQLNPAPWFFILFMSWLVILSIFKTKVLLSCSHTSPTTPDLLTHHSTPWNWPWI